MESILVTGRRKEAVARVRMREGTGRILVNGQPMEQYFGRASLQSWIREPLQATEAANRFDCIAQVAGGGIAGQAGALRHGVARALSAADHNLRLLLRKGGFLTRDSRARERKKYGQKGARKRFQWTKR